MATEHIEYKVIQVFDDFEIRQYPPIVVAETKVNTPIEEASEKALPLLAGYVFDKNLHLASPLSVSSKGKDQTMDFFLPDFKMAEDAPKPTDPLVVIRKLPERKMAVYTYTGAWSETRYNKAKNTLLKYLEQEHIRPVSDPIWARYNPPWWPWFMRRNEIWFEVKT
jgi:hypothetical protein